MIQAKPYKMHNPIQNYAWGTRDDQAFIAKFLQFPAEKDTPYAEVWLGAHPKAPSMIIVDGKEQALNDLIRDYPEPILGKAVNYKYHSLPFLYKVLSAGQSLSIQAHPNKEQAVILHEADAEHYPDSNHKPEIAVALDHLTALMGFQPLKALLTTLKMYPELAEFIGPNVIAALSPVIDSQITLQAKRVQLLAKAVINRAVEEPEALDAAIRKLALRLGNQLELSEREQLFFESLRQYGSQDVGLVFLFLLNLVHLQRGQAIYTPAGVPHAYLNGNILECMANSDNVVRVGLTPKFKDSAALVTIIDATPQSPVIMTPEDSGNEVVYMTPAIEFELRRWTITASTPVEVDSEAHPAVLLVTEGDVSIYWNENESLKLKKGESVLIPACLAKYRLTSTQTCEIHWCGVPV